MTINLLQFSDVKNIGMYSMIDGKPNPTFKMIASVLNNVAEMERNNMLERQKAGIELAKLQGKYKGRLYGSRMTDEEFHKKYKKVEVELKNGESLRRAAKLGGSFIGSCSEGEKTYVDRYLIYNKFFLQKSNAI